MSVSLSLIAMVQMLSWPSDNAMKASAWNAVEALSLKPAIRSEERLDRAIKAAVAFQVETRRERGESKVIMAIPYAELHVLRIRLAKSLLRRDEQEVRSALETISNDVDGWQKEAINEVNKKIWRVLIAVSKAILSAFDGNEPDLKAVDQQLDDAEELANESVRRGTMSPEFFMEVMAVLTDARVAVARLGRNREAEVIARETAVQTLKKAYLRVRNSTAHFPESIIGIALMVWGESVATLNEMMRVTDKENLRSWYIIELSDRFIRPSTLVSDRLHEVNCLTLFRIRTDAILTIAHSEPEIRLEMWSHLDRQLECTRQIRDAARKKFIEKDEAEKGGKAEQTRGNGFELLVCLAEAWAAELE